MRLLFEKSKAFPLQDILLTTALVAVIVIVAPLCLGLSRNLSAAPAQQAYS
jgi:hypothetical protein